MVDILLLICVFVFSFLVGHALIVRVPPRLHTPLMSMTNAVSGVTILGALLLFTAEATSFEKGLGVVGLALAAFNLVGGFTITDRMLGFFRKR